MRVTRVNEPQTGMKKKILRSAATGGALTAGVLTAAQTYSFAVQSDSMKRMVNEYGGTVPYLKNFALGAVMLTGLSAVLSGLVSYLAEKVHPMDPPNAAN